MTSLISENWNYKNTENLRSLELSQTKQQISNKDEQILTLTKKYEEVCSNLSASNREKMILE